MYISKCFKIYSIKHWNNRFGQPSNKHQLQCRNCRTTLGTWNPLSWRRGLWTLYRTFIHRCFSCWGLRCSLQFLIPLGLRYMVLSINHRSMPTNTSRASVKGTYQGRRDSISAFSICSKKGREKYFIDSLEEKKKITCYWTFGFYKFHIGILIDLVYYDKKIINKY